MSPYQLAKLGQLDKQCSTQAGTFGSWILRPEPLGIAREPLRHLLHCHHPIEPLYCRNCVVCAGGLNALFHRKEL